MLQFNQPTCQPQWANSLAHGSRRIGSHWTGSRSFANRSIRLILFPMEKTLLTRSLPFPNRVGGMEVTNGF